jgi:hypothetical protein
MQIEDPDGIRIVLIEIPADHPLRRDPRPALPPRRRTACRITTRSTETRWSSVRPVGGTHKGHQCQEGVRTWPGDSVLPPGWG